LVPVGMRSGGEAIDATYTALIGKDVQARSKASVTYAMFSNTNDVTLPTWFYDRDGSFVGTTVSGSSFYRADGTIHGSWGAAAPPNVDATVMRPTTVQVRWPVNTS